MKKKSKELKKVITNSLLGKLNIYLIICNLLFIIFLLLPFVFTILNLGLTKTGFYFSKMDYNFFPTLITSHIALCIGCIGFFFTFYGIAVGTKFKINDYFTFGISNIYSIRTSILLLIISEILIIANYIPSKHTYYLEYLIIFNMILTISLTICLLLTISNFANESFCLSIINFHLLNENDSKSTELINFDKKFITPYFYNTKYALYEKTIPESYDENSNFNPSFTTVIIKLTSIDSDLFKINGFLTNYSKPLDYYLPKYKFYNILLRNYCVLGYDIIDCTILDTLYKKTIHLYIACLLQHYDKSDILNILEPLRNNLFTDISIINGEENNTKKDFSVIEKEINLYKDICRQCNHIIYKYIFKTRNFPIIRNAIQNFLDFNQTLYSELYLFYEDQVSFLITHIANYIYLGELDSSFENLYISMLDKIEFYSLFLHTSDYEEILFKSTSETINRNYYFFIGLTTYAYYNEYNKLPRFECINPDTKKRESYGYKLLKQKINEIHYEDVNKICKLSKIRFAEIKVQIDGFLSKFN